MKWLDRIMKRKLWDCVTERYICETHAQHVSRVTRCFSCHFHCCVRPLKEDADML